MLFLVFFLLLFFSSKSSAKITINEIHPNPNEEKEWIELLYSPDEEESSQIENYSLEDSYHQIYLFSDEIFNSNKLLTVEVSGLNNDGDQVILKDSESKIIDQFSYNDTEKGLSWSWISSINSFQLNNPSKSLPNPEISPIPSNSPSISVAPISISPIVKTTSPKTSINPQVDSSQTLITPSIIHYHNYNPQKIKLSTAESPFKNRESRMVFIQEKIEKKPVINAIIGGSMISFSAYTLLYVKIKKN